MPEIQDPTQEQIETLKPLLPPEKPLIISSKVRTSALEDDIKVFRELNAVPNWTPSNPLDRIKIYISGSTYALFVWDNTNKTWRYTILT